MILYLVDTSAWILSFSAHPPPHLKTLLDEALDQDRVQTCGVVVAELLQGCREGAERKLLRDRLGALHSLDWSEPDWVTLGETSADLRGRGATVPLADLMIALLAMRHRSTVLHRDRHFDLIARHLPLATEKV